jgi:hypothetical protein
VRTSITKRQKKKKKVACAVYMCKNEWGKSLK